MLEKQTLNIPLTQGLDTKTDIKQLPTGKLSLLTNGSFKTPGSMRKRYGRDALSQSTVTGGTVSSGNNINVYQNELDIIGSNTLYSYADSQSKWVSKGAFPTLSITAKSVARNTYEQTNQCSAIHSGGLQVFAWEDSSGGVRYSVVDSTTGNQVVNNDQVSSTGSMPRVNVVGTNFVITYFDGTNIVYKSISTSTPSTLSGSTNIATDVNTSSITHTPIFDTAVINSRVYIAYNNSNPGLSMYYLDSSLVLSSKYTNNTTTSNYQALTVFGDASNQAWVAYSTNSTVRVLIAAGNLGSTVLSPTTLESVAALRITGITSGTTATIYYEITATNAWFHYVRSNTMTQAGTAGTAATFMRQHGLGSKVFAVSSVNYLFLSHESTLQPTYFLFNGSGVVVTKFAPNLGGGLPTKMQLPEINLVSTNNYQWAYLEKELATASDGQVVSVRGVMGGTINFAPSFVQTQNAGKNLVGNGGISQMYDGATPVEQGFHLSPENLTGDYSPTYGGLTTGQYQYQAVYEWIDNQGQRHRSSPSPSLTVNVDNHKTTVYGSLTSGSKNVTSTLPTTGPLVSTGAVSGTGVVANDYIGSVASTTGFALNTNATASTTASPIAMTVGYVPATSYRTTLVFNASTAVGPLAQNQLRVLPIKYRTSVGGPTAGTFIFGNLTSGSAVMSVDGDLGVVKVGYTLMAEINTYFGSTSVTISSINTTARTITLSAASTVTTYIALEINPTATGTATNGSPTITGLSSTVTSWFSVGDTIVPGSRFPAVEQIVVTAVTSTTITVTQNAVSSGSFTFTRSWNPTELLREGLTVTSFSNIFTGNATITALDVVDETPYGGYVGYVATLDVDFYAPTGVIFAVHETAGATITCPSLPATLKVAPRTPVSVALYRTEANGTVFYRTSSVDTLVYNDPSSDTVTFFDQTTDYVLVGNELLYTLGGEVENDPLPATNYLTTYKNRLIGIPSENPLQWWYSKQCVPGSPPEFSLSFVNNIDQRIGSIVACSYMDDKLVFFGPKHIYYIVGDGPSSSGLNNDFSDPQLIASDTGCSEAPSVVLSPVGLFFKSAKGICLLTRSLDVLFIGADVESYNSLSVVNSFLVDQQNQIRFNLSDGTQLTYDYFVKQWDTDLNTSVVGGIQYSNVANYLTSAGLVLRENTSIYTDNSSAISLGVNTGWLSFAGVQGYQRVWKLLILGTYRSPHTLTVNIYTDFDDTTPQTVSIPVLSDPGNYEFRVFLTQQKCESIKITISDTPSSPLGEGYSLSNLALEVGVKKGLNKLKAANSYG